MWKKSQKRNKKVLAVFYRALDNPQRGSFLPPLRERRRGLNERAAWVLENYRPIVGRGVGCPGYLHGSDGSLASGHPGLNLSKFLLNAGFPLYPYEQSKSEGWITEFRRKIPLWNERFSGSPRCSHDDCQHRGLRLCSYELGGNHPAAVDV